VWLAYASVGYVGGMILNYAALATGRIGIVAPITSTEGAIAAVMAVIGGEAATPLLLVLLGMVAAGLLTTTLEPGVRASAFVSGDRRYLLFAGGAALLFGTSLYAAGHASASAPLGWVVIAGRLVGVLAVTLPLIVLGRLRCERSAMPYLVIAGLLEVAGYLTFAWGAREGIAITAMLSSQFAVLAAVGAHLLGERLAPRQWAGVGVVAVGVAAITLLRV
jgi:drug/metabolite transporter (DMT)-like permease